MTAASINYYDIGILGVLILIGAAIHVARKGIRLDVRDHRKDDEVEGD